MKLGLVGYGFGGRVFHAPFIHAAKGVEIAGVVARSADKIAALAKDMPGVPVYGSLTELIAAGEVDAVTITTPPETHKPLVLEAIAAKLHVVCDKPFAPTYADAKEMAEAAKDAGVLLNVFHNRRWDSDYSTFRALFKAGRLGKVSRVHNRMDFNDPGTLEAGPGGGLLRDLGSHIIDQMLVLFGAPISVDAQLDHATLEAGETDVSFAIHLVHESGTHSYISASKTHFLDQREIRAYGSAGTYVVNGTDVQARAVMAGEMPHDGESWGVEPTESWGVLHGATGREVIPCQPSRIQDLYTEFARAAQSGDTVGPVPMAGALLTVRVLDAARQAARDGRTVFFHNRD